MHVSCDATRRPALFALAILVLQAWGTHAATCSKGLTLCQTTCVNLQTDSSNCGSCANVCPANKACFKGACTERGMWLWNTKDFFNKATATTDMINTVKAAGVTDLYLFLTAATITSSPAAILGLVSKVNAAGLRAWALEGYRGYFSDIYGPAKFLAAVDAVVAYNNRADVVTATARFVGFSADNEPYATEVGYPDTFHKGIKDSALNTSAGSGVWKASEAEDRNALLQDWLATYQTAIAKLAAASPVLRFGAAVPYWLNSYNGEPLSVTSGGVTDAVWKRMLALMRSGDQFQIMSYTTKTDNLIRYVADEMAYASSAIPAASRPCMFGGVEVTTGVGTYVSYGDTTGKKSKAVVLSDLALLSSNLSATHASFCGINIHDWRGWKALSA